MTERAFVEELGRDVASLFGHAPDQTIALGDDGWIALSGEPGAADLNMAAVYPGASSSGALAILRRLRETGLGVLVLLPSADAGLRGLEETGGLTLLGQAPAMERVAAPFPDSPPLACRARRGTADDMAAAMDLAAEAFQLPQARVQRAMPAALLDEGQRDLWVAEDQGGTMLGVGLFLRDGDRVGIYTMATAPQQQRQGAGRAVLVSAMRHYQEAGVSRFTLFATEAGLRLYEQVGFRTVAQPHIAALGQSTQFPADG